MPGEFNVKRPYSRERDVRDWSDLIEQVRPGKPAADGLCWVLVGPRRSGKTYALAAIEHGLDGCSVSRHEVRGLTLEQMRALTADVVLVDEAGPHIRRDIVGFMDAMRHLKGKGARIVLAVTPGEWRRLLEADGHAGRLPPNHARYIEPLSPDGARALAARAPWAPAVVELLPTAWTRSPYLLEYLLHTYARMSHKHGLAVRHYDGARALGFIRDRLAEGAAVPDDADAHAAPDELLTLLVLSHGGDAPAAHVVVFRQFVERCVELAVEECAEDLALGDVAYVRQVFYEGLSRSQREMLRECAMAGRASATKGDLDFVALKRCGLMDRDRVTGRDRITDPMLARHLPPVLIAHHVSDVHVGPKSAGIVDDKRTDVQVPGDATVRDHYASHVRELGADRPHLLIVSGDLVEYGDNAGQYAEAKRWLGRVMDDAPAHPLLPPDAPRTLFAPGNHDVAWSAVEGAAPQARHAVFAEHFAGQPRPRLEEAPATRKLEVVDLGEEVGVEVVLLGSAEQGGQLVQDPIREELELLVADLLPEAMKSREAGNWARYIELRRKLDRIDPGLVNPHELAQLANRKTPRARIVALHHPVTPLPANPEVARYGGLLNAGAVRDALFASRTELVLHGHQHTGWIAHEEWPVKHPGHRLTIAAAPSLGSREASEENGFNEIRVQREGDGITIAIRCHRRQGTVWTAGERVFVVKRPSSDCPAEARP